MIDTGLKLCYNFSVESKKYVTTGKREIKMKIVCIGDSITYGYNVDYNQSWIHPARQKTGYEIINCGINGDTSGGMLARFYDDVITEKPDYVHIMGGVNDIICINNADIVKPNIMAMISQTDCIRMNWGPAIWQKPFFPISVNKRKIKYISQKQSGKRLINQPPTR